MSSVLAVCAAAFALAAPAGAAAAASSCCAGTFVAQGPCAWAETACFFFMVIFNQAQVYIEKVITYRWVLRFYA